MEKIKVMGYHQPPPPFSLMTPPYPNDTPNSPHICQKMRKGCRNNYIEAFGAAYGVKKAV